MSSPRRLPALIALLLLASPLRAGPLELKPDARVVLLGGGLGARMLPSGVFETELHLRLPGHRLFIRNVCDEGDTPGFRPHSARDNPWAHPGAEKFRTLETATDRWGSGNVGNGFYPTSDEWLKRLRPDVIVAFFGYGESFEGPAGLENFRAELDGFVRHTLSTAYNGAAAPRLALVSPIAFQNLSALRGTPDGVRENANLALYTEAMRAVAALHGVGFVDLFTPTHSWFSANPEPLTRDGALLTDAGYARLVPVLLDGLFGRQNAAPKPDRASLQASVRDLNWFWQNYYKIPNGVHVYGRRHKPHGPKNYPAELHKLGQMLDNRDQAVWALLAGTPFDLAAADARTDPLPDLGTPKATYLPPAEAAAKLAVPEGYRIELFASEAQFPDLANPVQLSFDNRGRLWVATMPSYPHYRPGDPRPDDKLLILEDTNADGRADKQTVFAGGLHLPMGFEFGADGVYVSQGYSLVLLRDTNGDDHADTREVVFSGFDDHDTHHAISAFCADPSGAFYLAEGTFLHSHVETAYGTVRSSNGGFFRYNPARQQLERSARLSIPNPWGIAIDHWGQPFFADTSDPNMRWMLPGTVQVGYGKFAPTPPNLLSVLVRPTSGLEFVSSRHFPDDVQGDILINNTIGFLGTKQHTLVDDGTGYKSTFRQDLVKGSDPNFRPVDMEFAPDGSLYLVDWHNALIGHMQHNARDPDRDHAHGRIYRVTYPGRPLVHPALVAGAPIATLLDNLKLPEYRTRYRTRRELRGRDKGEVLAAITRWTAGLNDQDPASEHHRLESLWVTWGLNQIDQPLLRRLLASPDHRVRAAAVEVLRHSRHQVPDHAALLATAAADPHGRVRLAAITAASWLNQADGLAVLEASKTPRGGTEAVAAAPLATRVDAQGVLHATVPPANRGTFDAVILALPGSGKTLNLAEVRVLSGGKDIAAQAKAFQSSEYDATMRVGRLTDGNLDTFAHSREHENNPWFKFEFAAPVAIDEVVIHNRKNYESRFDGGQVRLASGGKDLLTFTVNLAGGETADGMDAWITPVYKTALAHLQGQAIEGDKAPTYTTHLTGADKAVFLKGAEVYNREGHCITCHQPDGKGLPAAQFPPLAGSPWVTGSEERLIKLTLHGLMGPIEVNGTTYPGLVPMTPFKMLPDEEVAAVLTFVRNTFGHRASVVRPETVRRVREATKDQASFLDPSQLLKQHPHDPGK